MELEHVEFTCAACGLHLSADEAPDRTEGETYLRLFWCGREKTSHLLDAEAPDFRGRCPDCDEHLTVLHFPVESCPKCLTPARQRKAYTGPL